MVESINSCTLVASSSLMSCPPPGTPSLHPIPSHGILPDGAVQHARFRLSRLPPVALPAVTPIVLLALLLWPVAAVAQSPSWEDHLGSAERAWDRGQTAEAERQYLGAVKQAESFGPADPRLAQSLTALGLFYREQGRIPEASPVLHRALSVIEQSVSADDVRLVVPLNNVGATWLQQGLVGDAEPVVRRALSIAEKKLGADDLETARAMINLGAVHQTRARYAEAEPLYRGALQVQEKALGPSDLEVARTLSSLGALYREQARYAEAGPLYQRAIVIVERAVGDRKSTRLNSSHV